jgi:hypothetical protein
VVQAALLPEPLQVVTQRLACAADATKLSIAASNTMIFTATLLLLISPLIG